MSRSHSLYSPLMEPRELQPLHITFKLGARKIFRLEKVETKSKISYNAAVILSQGSL